MTGLVAHLAEGVTTVCRAWELARADGVRLGFTDHDESLNFDGLTYSAQSGFDARALEYGLGLAVGNSEVLGALSDAAIREEDIALGRYDGAEVTEWLVNWNDPTMRRIRFCGRLGEIHREDGRFRAELRSLSADLGTPIARTIQPLCSARLGDARCGVDLTAGERQVEGAVVSVFDDRIALNLDAAPEEGWFARGVLQVLSGVAVGIETTVLSDKIADDGLREIALEDALPLVGGDRLLLTAGCDGTPDNCQAKFDNFINFRGFPYVPGEDWRMRVPRASGANDGGALR